MPTAKCESCSRVVPVDDLLQSLPPRCPRCGTLLQSAPADASGSGFIESPIDESGGSTDDYDALWKRTAPRFPRTLVAAVVIWLSFGGLAALAGTGYLVLRYLEKQELLPVDAPEFVQVMLFLGGIIGVAVGVKCLRGEFKDTLHAGNGSLLMGVYFLIAPAAWGSELSHWVFALALGVLGTAFVSAAVLAYMARARYRAWRHPPGDD